MRKPGDGIVVDNFLPFAIDTWYGNLFSFTNVDDDILRSNTSLPRRNKINRVALGRNA
jgi:hypothetical protein